MSAVVALSATAVLFGQTALTTPTSTAAVAPAANTLLVMGGNGNPDGVNMEKELKGYISGNPGTRYEGYIFTPVKWSAQTPITAGADGTLFSVSQAEGLDKINTALQKTYAPGSKLVIVGYSSSASVVSKQINQLQAKRDPKAPATAANPSPSDLSFVLFGNPTRPNGGFFSRYPGYKIGPPLGVDFQEPLGKSDYQVTDVCRQYDGFCDYPVDPTNPLVMMNTALGMYFDHGDYFNVDITNKDSILVDQQDGNTRYITVKNTLPLLRFLPGFLQGPLDAILRPQIEAAYDRSNIGTQKSSKVSAANDPLLQLVNNYLRLFGGSGSGTQTPVTAPTTTVNQKVATNRQAQVAATTESTSTTTAPTSTTSSTSTSSGSGSGSTTTTPSTSATTSTEATTTSTGTASDGSTSSTGTSTSETTGSSRSTGTGTSTTSSKTTTVKPAA